MGRGEGRGPGGRGGGGIGSLSKMVISTPVCIFRYCYQ